MGNVFYLDLILKSTPRSVYNFEKFTVEISRHRKETFCNRCLNNLAII